MIALYIILAIFSVLIAGLGFILFTKLTVILSVGSEGLIINICKFGIKYKIPLKKDKNKEKKEKTDVEKKLSSEDGIMKKFFDIRNNFMRQKNAISEALSYLKGKISLDEIGIIGKFGTGNPVSGGMAYGSIHAFVNTVTAFSAQFFSVKKPPSVNVKFFPDKAVFEMTAAFLLKAKPIDILKALYKYKKILKKGNK